MNKPMNHLYEFGSLRLDATDRLLYRNGIELPLQPRLIETLVALVERSNVVVDKDSLINTVWGETVVEEGGLKRNISMLRKALGEDGRFIETLPKRGYRLTAEVKETWEDASVTAPHDSARELVLERRANLLISCEEEITRSPVLDDRIQTTAQKMTVVARAGRIGLLVSAAIILSLVVAFGYMLAKGNISKAGAAVPVKSIAVLPFKTLGASGDDEHLGVGVTDVLITRLSNLKEVTVRPTSAVLKYDQQEQDSVAAGRALGVEAVLEGSIQHSEGRIRVTVRLIRISDQSSIWAGQFDEKARDMLAVQDALSEQVVDSLALSLSVGERATLAKRYTENADAYQLFIKARYHWNTRTSAGMTEAQYFFRRAIEKDPNFALAYVGLADALFTGKASSEAYSALEKAIEIDGTLGEAYAAEGFAAMFQEWNWRKAEESLARAIELNPGYGTAHQWYATLLAITGRVEEAKREIKRALEIDPLSANFLADAGQMHYFAREYEEAEGYCRKALDVSPDFNFAHHYLFDIYLETGRSDEAFDEYLKTIRSYNSDPKYLNNRIAAAEARHKELFRQSGMTGILRQTVDDALRNRAAPCYEAARCSVLLGDRQQALAWLEKSYENHDFLAPFANADPVFDALRSEPRYQAVLHHMGLAS